MTAAGGALDQPLTLIVSKPNAAQWLVAVVLVAGVVAAVHWPVLSAQALSLDDNAFLTENELVRNPSWASVKTFFVEVLDPSTVGGYYLPLAMTSLMVDCALGGRPDDLTVFHRTSLTLHVLNALLVMVLLWLLFRNLTAAACVAILYGAHPLTVETVAWIGERKTLLATFFAFSCLILYVLFAQRRRRWLIAFSVVCFMLSLLSKPTASAIPALLILLDIWPLNRIRWRTIIEKAPYFIVAGVSIIITMISHARTASLEFPQELDPWRAPLMICRNVIFYLYKIVWPVHLSSAYYVPEPLTLAQPMVLAGVVFMVIAAPLLLWTLRWTRSIAIGGVFFFVAIFPVLGAVRYSWISASDKYVYFPAIGLLMVLAYWMVRMFHRAVAKGRFSRVRGGLVAIVCVVVLFEAAGVRDYLTHWRETEGLWRYTVDQAPDSPRSLVMLGNALLEHGNVDEGVENFERAVRIDPRYSAAHSMLGVIRLKRGQVRLAIDHWEQAIRVAPRFAAAHANLAVALAETDKIPEAIEHFERALELKPKYESAHNNYAMLLYRMGRLEDAHLHAVAAVDCKPGYADAHFNLAIISKQLGRLDEALRHADEALRLGIEPVRGKKACGDILVELGRFDEAVKRYSEAAEMAPDQPTLVNNLAFALIKAGRPDKADPVLKRLLDQHPEDLNARMNFAHVKQVIGQREAAIGEYRQVLRLDPDNEYARQQLANLRVESGE